MIENCTALILAGGDSRRMGRDKASLQLGGRSLLQRMLDLMQTLFPAVLVSTRQRREEIDAPQVCDGVPGLGPLAGLCAGLEAAQENGVDWVFAVATDMPYLVPELVERLAAMRGGQQAVVPLIDAYPEPVVAFYAVTALPALQAALAQGQRSLHGALAGLDVRYVDAHCLREADEGLRSFIDLDTPEDAAAARQHFGD